ncbi:carboxymuconolactone decarboxylase family protein [Actinomadura barringtoniae]|uniref:Carboxymuconolactone decarboxylase family protein n=1 Tax=Actinomadura barringtoniae TaxID=1427535 RepID=A0A939PFM3_9ACTN|nr:carboxymuconolactone decarboxylase family protein [Actinomadura barringtoniae]MBO2451408.1 carboxymuconolactone decarboxylase family protein [Actinomadura barringtoniae]
MPEPRIRPGSLREVGLLTWSISQVSGRATGTTPPNLFLTLGLNRGLFRGWLRFASKLMPRGTLPRRETELVILRVAHLCDCAYEFEHHVRLGRRAGVSATDVDRVTAGPSAEGWNTREHAILLAVDQLHTTRDLDDTTWSRLRSQLTEPECIELMLLAGHYEMLATTIIALRIQPDRKREHRS